jgi:hemolysin activation/secretion protein
LLWDTRDRTLSPTTGRYLELTSLFALAEVDMSGTSFSIISLDARTYKRIGDHTTWANQLVIQTSFGDVPFRELPALGGPYLHRGYYQGRFRDKNLFLFQSELRCDITNRWGLAAFVSAGRVGTTFMDKLLGNIHPAVGSGIRFKIDKEDQTTIRLDYSITPDSRGFYLFFAEAF